MSNAADTNTTREIGGYFELEHFEGHELHEGALALNCARSCLAYVVEARHIRTLWVPYFLCSSIDLVMARYPEVTIKKFEIAANFEPAWDRFAVADDEYLYLVDFYGQLSDAQIAQAAERVGGRIVVDEVMAYFHMPLPGLDTLYSCRKFFGVADGGYLYTTAHLGRPIASGQSHDKMGFVLGRAELPANDFYPGSVTNNRRFREEDIEWMSPITHNLLRAIDYDRVAARRRANFELLAETLDRRNELHPIATDGAFMYPFLTADGERIRKQLQQRKIYVSMLWDYALDTPGLADRYARDILPLPVDQRYDADDMRYQLDVLEELMRG